LHKKEACLSAIKLSIRFGLEKPGSGGPYSPLAVVQEAEPPDRKRKAPGVAQGLYIIINIHSAALKQNFVHHTAKTFSDFALNRCKECLVKLKHFRFHRQR